MIPPTTGPSTRRALLKLTGQAALFGAFAPRLAFAASDGTPKSAGAIAGDPIAVKVGEKILQDGGNAIDAAIASAFAAGICTSRNCGVGGYGGHATIALAGEKKITCIDFNSIAPAAAHDGMFPRDDRGVVKGNVNTVGWLAAGVPGTLADLELALQRYGTRSLRHTLAPAIEMCERGTHVAAVNGLDDVARPPSTETPALPPPPIRRRPSIQWRLRCRLILGDVEQVNEFALSIEEFAIAFFVLEDFSRERGQLREVRPTPREFIAEPQHLLLDGTAA